MLDIKLFRENPDLIKESEKKRFKDPAMVDKVVDYDKRWREKLKEVQELKRKKNEISREIAKLKGESKEKKVIEATKLDEKIKELEHEAEFLKKQREKFQYKIGNILHESVPVAPEEDDNEIVREVGKIRKFNFEPKPHADLVERFAELERASRISGARTYYLKGDLVLLNLALVDFAIKNLRDKGFNLMWTPYFIKAEMMRGASELADFEEQLYKVEGEDLYLIATSEQALASLHFGEVLDEKKLPLKYAGYSSCFRREAGSHGKDTKGIFRIHQFDKVEQFVFCKPEQSWNIFEELIRNAEELYQALGIPYRIVNIASGEMNDNAAKKYDLEVWFPAQKKYRELVSCSNCTDYQARKLNVRVGKYGGKKEFVHTLNSTAIATERTITAILENYQRENGKIEVPKVLQKFVGKEVI
jgi:seryl-tRNA synthetase